MREAREVKTVENCAWSRANEKLSRYHDTEWGVPLHDDHLLFEHLMLEVMQCGLNWNMMLQKREIFHHCFDHFDFDRIAAYTEEDIARIMAVPGMIRSRRKIEAVIHNARCYRELRQAFGSFDAYLWAFTDGHMLVYSGHPQGVMPPRNGLSDRISADLRKRGFKFVGPVTVYSFLQAVGMVNDHYETCPRFHEVMANHPVRYEEPDQE